MREKEGRRRVGPKKSETQSEKFCRDTTLRTGLTRDRAE